MLSSTCHPTATNQRNMESDIVTSLTDRYFKYAEEMVADLKSQKLSKLDADLLQQKMTELTEKFDAFKSDFDAAVKQEKKRGAQETLFTRAFEHDGDAKHIAGD
jgi:hypothetical protein